MAMIIRYSSKHFSANHSSTCLWRYKIVFPDKLTNFWNKSKLFYVKVLFFISCFNYCLQTSFENVHFILYFRRCKWHENEVEQKTLKKGIKTTEMFPPFFETAIIFNIQMVFFLFFLRFSHSNWSARKKFEIFAKFIRVEKWYFA